MKPQIALKILLALSIINAVFSFLGEGMMALFLPSLERVYSSHPEVLEEFHMTATWEVMAQVPRPYYGVMALLAALSFTGCLLMWKYRRAGFHCYTLAQLLMLLLPLLLLGKGAVGLGNVMFTVLFVVYYWLLLKRIEAATAPAPSDQSDPSDPTDLSN